MLSATPLAAQSKNSSPRQMGESAPSLGATGGIAVPANQASQEATRQAAIGDLSGGRFIPKPILEILADRRIDPNIAYILWQTARKPLKEWTLNELAFVAQIAPTLAEAGIPVAKLEGLFKFMGLNPEGLFNPQPEQSWQSRSTAFDPSSAANVAAISSADCQTDPGTMTVATFQACTGGAP